MKITQTGGLLLLVLIWTGLSTSEHLSMDIGTRMKRSDNLSSLKSAVKKLNDKHPSPNCTCDFKEKEAHCWHLENERVPICITPYYTELILQTAFTQETFWSVPHLESLTIKGTEMFKIPKGAFTNLKSLKVLKFQEDPELWGIEEGIFDGLENLVQLSLDKNNIIELDKYAFSPLKNLEILNLAHNQINVIAKGCFDNNVELREIDLSFNRIQSKYLLGLFRYNTKLRILRLRNVEMEAVPYGFLTYLNELRFLDLSQNHLRQLDAFSLAGCPHLEQLYINGNEIKYLDPALFVQHNIALKSVKLQHNKWYCNCDIIPVAGWTVMRNDALEDDPVCDSPDFVKNVTLQKWFDHYGKDCEATFLQSELSVFLGLATSIAKHLNYSKPANVSHAASAHFYYNMASKTGADVSPIVERFNILLQKVIEKKYDMNISEDRKKFVSSPIALPGVKPLLRFAFVLQDIPKGMQPEVYRGIEDELASLLNPDVNHDHSSNISENRLIIGIRQELREVVTTLLTSQNPSSWEIAKLKKSSASFLNASQMYVYVAAVISMNLYINFFLLL